MKTPWKWLLLCSGLSLLPAAQAATDTKPLLAKQFKKTVGTCWVYTDGNDNDYCMSAGPSREVTIDGKTQLYALALGDAYDYANKQPNQAHAYSGIAALYVYQKSGNGWQLIHRGKPDNIGAHG